MTGRKYLRDCALSDVLGQKHTFTESMCTKQEITLIATVCYDGQIDVCLEISQCYGKQTKGGQGLNFFQRRQLIRNPDLDLLRGRTLGICIVEANIKISPLIKTTEGHQVHFDTIDIKQYYTVNNILYSKERDLSWTFSSRLKGDH